jgi:hypothetical protein
MDKFCRACKKAVTTTTAGACIICGALTSGYAPASGAQPAPSHQIKILDPPQMSLSTLSESYSSQRIDYHYGEPGQLRGGEGATVMGSATITHDPWPFSDPPWEPPALD